MYIIPVDMILLDRMLEKQNQDAARNLFIKGDVTLLRPVLINRKR